MVRLHRWVGLGIALFLAITGLTGSILAYREPLDRWLNPDLFDVEPVSFRRPLPVGEMAQRIERALPQAEPFYLPLSTSAGENVVVLMKPRQSHPAPLGFDQAFFDPYDGKLLATRNTGGSLFDRRSTMGFIYKLHRQLALPVVWGTSILGLVSILWTLDSFTGLALTFPSRGNGAGRKSWWARWKTAWTFKRGASSSRRVLDLHRAGSLWLWGMLLIFAWSSVMLTAEPVYRAVMTRFVTFDEPRRALPVVPERDRDMRLDWGDALAAGRKALPEAARRFDFTSQGETELVRDRNRNLYIYYVRSNRDIRDDSGSTGLFIDGTTGRLITVSLPTKAGAAGNAFTQWMYGLHLAQVFGAPYRLFVMLFGLAITGLSVTGIILWWRKRRAHRIGEKRRRIRKTSMASFRRDVYAPE